MSEDGRQPDYRWDGQPTCLYASARPFSVKGQLRNAVNLVYIIQVYDDDNNSWEDVTRELRQPLSLGSSAIVVIDPSQILSDTIKTIVRVSGGGALRMKHTLRMYKIIGTPEALNTSTGLLEYNEDRTQWVSTLSNFVVDAAPQHKEVAATSEQRYMEKKFIRPILNSVTGWYRFATNRPDVIHRCDPNPYSLGETEGFNDYISYYQFSKDPLTPVATIYLDDGTNHTQAIANATPDYGHFSLGIGTIQLKQYLGNTTWSTITSAGTKRVVKIEYYLRYFGGTRATNIMTTLVSNKNCCIEDTNSIEILWKNRQGGTDTFMLKGATEIVEEHEFDTFQRVLGFRRHPSEDSEAGPFLPQTYTNTFHQGSTNVAKINIRARKKLKIISQFMNKETIRWAAEIVTAPRVWVRESYSDIDDDTVVSHAGKGYLQQVYCNTTEVTIKDKKTGLGQLELDLVYANPIVTQRI